MSRYEFNAPGVNLAIGWDGPLASFFLTIWVDELQGDDDESPHLWIGASYGEAPYAAPVLAIARHHVPTIPADFIKQLVTDQMRQPARALAAGTTTLDRLLNTLAGAQPVMPTHH